MTLRTESAKRSAVSLAPRLQRARQWQLEYGGYLSNHLTHNWVVLAHGGAPAALLDAWEQRYTRASKDHALLPAAPRLRPTRPVLPAAVLADPHRLRPLLERYRGAGMGAFADAQERLDAALAVLGRARLLAVLVPWLADGVAGAAFHPVIHCGLGAEAGSDSMIADGLAYWLVIYQPLGSVRTTGWCPSASASAEVLPTRLDEDLTRARAQQLYPAVWRASQQPRYEQRRRGAFQQRMMTFSAPELPQTQWLDALAPFPLPPEQQPLDDVLGGLRRWLAQALLDSSNEFFVLHALTSGYALGQLLPLLDPAAQRHTLTAWLRAVLATLVAQGVPLAAGAGKGAGESAADAIAEDWSALRTRSWDSTDEHIPKAVYALWRWYCLRPRDASSACFVAAAKALVAPNAAGDPAANLWFADPPGPAPP